MAANGWLCQFLADILQVRVQRPLNVETTALGAAFLAGLATGVWSNRDEVSRTWAPQDEFTAAMGPGRRKQLLDGWRDAVERTKTAGQRP